MRHTVLLCNYFFAGARTSAIEVKHLIPYCCHFFFYHLSRNTFMPWPPHVTVATIVERDGRFLLVHEEAEGKQVYNQPAGHLEPNESLIEAAIRETFEETGWRVKPTALLGINLYQAPSNGVTYLRTSFIAEPVIFDREAKLDKEIIEAVWLTYEEILARRDQLRSPMTLQVIEDYRAGKHFPLAVLG
jgi:8-oxo-dGTP pyrophosphatase MutT (NUDIX family)